MTNQNPPSGPPAAGLQPPAQALEAELQAGQQQAMTLFSEAPVPYFLLNSQGRIQNVNAAGCGLLGRTREALLGKRLSRFLAPASQAAFGVLLEQVFRGGLRQRGEAELLHADGAPLDVLLDIGASRLDGEFQHFRLVMTDVTAHKQAHRGLLDTVTTQEGQIREQATRLRALNQELEGVVTVLIQQIRLPVARAMNFLGLLRRNLGEPPEEVTQPFLNTEQAVQQIIALLASVDRYMQMRGMRLRVRQVNLNSVLREVLKNARPLMTDWNVEVTSDPLPTVQGDSQALYVMLDEYVSNALKFTRGREAARVHVLVRESGAEYHIGVQDNGAGFNMRQRDRLFQLFGRLHSSRVYEGSGVGLVTVRRVCERFGGRVWAEGKVDQGATFWFAWPRQPRVRE